MTDIDLIVLKEASPAAVGVSIELLDMVNRLGGQRLLNWRILSPSGAQATLGGGMFMAAQPLVRAQARDIVILPGLGTETEMAARIAEPDAVGAARWVARAWARGATVAASCTGVFVLGAAGLLDRRHCTTAWWLVPALQAAFPDARATADAMVTEDERVWTAGAALAHLDLMLALVGRFVGPALADSVARHLLVDRRASQAPYVMPARLAAHDPLACAIETAVRERLAGPIALSDLARAAGVSPRTLARRIQAATGLSPMRFVQKIRLDTALQLLQSTGLSLEAIADRLGFADAATLYRLVRRHTGQPPSAFRRPERY
ncbi:MAG: GlxA family transcriptional regulator [Ferrovibrionaceae bacterium]